MQSELWFLCTAFDPSGGDSCRIVELAHEVEKRLGWEPVILTMRKNGQPDAESMDGIQVRRLSQQSHRIWDEMRFALAICREIRRMRRSIGAIHINSPGLESAWVVRRARCYGIRTVIQMTQMGSDDPQSLCHCKRFAGIGTQWFIRELGRADAIVGLSRALTGQAYQFGWPAEKIICSAMWKDPVLFRPAYGEDEKRSIRESFQLDAKDIVVSCVGYLSLRKGIDVLIQAWKQVASFYPHAKLLLAGEWGKGNDLNLSSFKALPDSAYRILGSLSRRSVAELLRASDIFVFPSRREGFGASLLEAIMSGLPAVASDLPGITDMMIRNGHNGILCKPDSVAELYHALERLIQSKDLRFAMGSASMDVVKEFHPEKIWPAYEAAYKGTSFDSQGDMSRA